MMTVKQMNSMTSMILLIGTCLSLFLVTLGGAMYLFEYGHHPLEYHVLRSAPTPTTVMHIWQFALSFSSVGIIELGLLLLVATQTIRVALLCLFYLITRDYFFTFISLFILLMLIYSSLWRH